MCTEGEVFVVLELYIAHILVLGAIHVRCKASVKNCFIGFFSLFNLCFFPRKGVAMERLAAPLAALELASPLGTSLSVSCSSIFIQLPRAGYGGSLFLFSFSHVLGVALLPSCAYISSWLVGVFGLFDSCHRRMYMN